jgi:hypothetical protein
LTASRVQRLAECLILLASLKFPPGIRQDRYREWTAELPAILNDPDIRPKTRRDLAALRFAAGHINIRMPGYTARHARVTPRMFGLPPFPVTRLLVFLFCCGDLASLLAHDVYLAGFFGGTVLSYWCICIFSRWRSRRRLARQEQAGSRLIAR